MIMYGLVKFGKSSIDVLVWIFYFFICPRFLDECDQQTECYCCLNRFHNDDKHQYILSNSHRLNSKKRLDLIALMQNDLLLTSPMHCSPPLPRNQLNGFVSVSCRKFNLTKNPQQQHVFVPSFLADRSSTISQFPNKSSLNRTQSSYNCNNTSTKYSPTSLSMNNCCHSCCSRTLSSTSQTSNSSSFVQQQTTNGRRYQTSGPASSSNSSLVDDDQQQQTNRRISHGDEIDCTTKLMCTVTNNEGYRRKKSASLNSPANSGKDFRFFFEKEENENDGIFIPENRPTADELERLELPWCWKSYSVSLNKRSKFHNNLDFSNRWNVIDAVVVSFSKDKDRAMSND